MDYIISCEIIIMICLTSVSFEKEPNNTLCDIAIISFFPEVKCNTLFLKSASLFYESCPLTGISHRNGDFRHVCWIV